jgi:hypothetical protein
MSTTPNPESWRVLIKRPELVEESIAAQLDTLEQLGEFPRIGSSLLVLIFVGWLNRCCEKGLLTQSERDRLQIALREAATQTDRDAFAALES